MESKSTSAPQHLYKALTTQEWNEFKTSGAFQGSELDKKDGFIHTSTASQLMFTLNKFFPVSSGIKAVIVKIDTSKLKPEVIKYEPSKPGKVGGELYYHIYDSLTLDHVAVN